MLIPLFNLVKNQIKATRHVFFCLAIAVSSSQLANPVLASHFDEKSEYRVSVQEELAELPEIGYGPESFTPTNWQLEKQCRGDLNGDGKDDLVIVVVRREGEGCFGQDIARSVIVAFAAGNNEYSRVAIGNGVARLEGTLMSDVSISVNRGSLVVSNLYSDRQLVVEKCRFRFSNQLKKFQLIGQDKYQCDRLTMNGKEESWNLLTGDRIVEEIKLGDVVVSKKTKEDKKPLLLFENVSIANIFKNCD